MAAESVSKTIIVSFVLCIVCSVIVASTAVLLRPRQELNKALDVKKNLLACVGLLDNFSASREEIDQAFEKVEPIIINLETGNTLPEIDPESFDQKKEARGDNVAMIPQNMDHAKIRQRAENAIIYLVKDNGNIVQIVLPVYGKGLYSTLYGFLAIAADTKTITGIAFYEHGETPGLGGEVDNPNWKAQWPGKMLFDDQWYPKFQVVKGGVKASSSDAAYQIDAISGATMTSRGVENLVHYWLSDHGYGPFLKKFRQQGGKV